MTFRLLSPQSYFVKQKLDGQFVMNKKGVCFELNGKERVKIALNAANLPVALASNTDDVTSKNLALYSCVTDATNTKGCCNDIIDWGTAILDSYGGWLGKDI